MKNNIKNEELKLQIKKLELELELEKTNKHKHEHNFKFIKELREEDSRPGIRDNVGLVSLCECGETETKWFQ